VAGQHGGEAFGERACAAQRRGVVVAGAAAALAGVRQRATGAGTAQCFVVLASTDQRECVLAAGAGTRLLHDPVYTVTIDGAERPLGGDRPLRPQMAHGWRSAGGRGGRDAAAGRPAPFADTVPRALATALREHNDTHPVEERIRLRMALHAGEVELDEHRCLAQLHLPTAVRYRCVDTC
jgi:hypothetical protein